MEFSFRQHQRQTQQQSLSPVLIKSLQLLSLPYPSLVSFLERHALENPFLEMRDDWPQCGDPVSAAWADGYASSMDPTPLFHCQDPMDSLQEHLYLQLAAAEVAPEITFAGRRLIERIDSRGYLSDTPENIAEQTGLPETTLREALKLIRTFSPKGVGAGDLKECLLLQADPQKCSIGLLRNILEGPVEKLERRDVRYFAKGCGVSVSEVGAAFQYLATLSPFPGCAFDSAEPTHYIYPEIEVTVSDGVLDFSFQSGCDLVSVNETLFQAISGQAVTTPDDREYVREKYGEATALVQELLLRKNAVEKLILFLLQVQRDYFLFPGGKLRPVTMRQAAAAMGVHPSTVSRCVNGRYIQTRDGILPLKAMFSAGLTAEQGEEVAPSEIKKEIQMIIQGEDAEHPVTDQAITERLSGQGMNIARRTVAKYREQMGIPVSHIRRRKGD